MWEWYAWRRERIASCRPNAAHETIARWTRQPENGGSGLAAAVRILTQNVDDLHVRAGTRDLVRLHGSIWELRCTRCPATWRDEQVPLPVLPPVCGSCGALARPGVVWFGEPLAAADVQAAEAACVCDVFIAAGTSAVVYPAAGLVHAAARAGAFTVEINPEPTAATAVVDVALDGGAEVVLPRLDACLSTWRVRS